LTQRMASTGTTDCSSAAKTSTATAVYLPLGGAEARVGVDDVLHDLVAHDILGRQAHERQAGDAGEDLLQAEQATALTRQVDLGDVAGDDRPRPEADAGEEHLHLLGRGVLRLVEDDEAVVQGVVGREEVFGD